MGQKPPAVPPPSNEFLAKRKREARAQRQPKHVGIVAEDHDDGTWRKSHSQGYLNRQYATTAGQISQELAAKLQKFFEKLDKNGDGKVEKQEAISFWGKNFAKVNAQSMFNEVDADDNGCISWVEFLAFWQNVAGNGYDLDDLEEEVDCIMEGGSWVDFDDGRTT
mmetsp:Transcript_74027/g.123621  ORF Transcript_74027/g.123621 Transcript_74027/m.123621 type:complete len:165 (+) Transcript_74027:47-541(+)|eukprot:CAMPEP_0119313502 /NCGR_PEP_ID=MMETSP1333-20130426/29331_1 /TAXON_ID=418940 /ORGANISM="Scyphosphaera apsteinii, Strain RCC1455" /LENGTH=164 /DNA_ID=CAMNT_0007318353 /DNA_START=43 /DNA_END=537 /DNA_ORIENTATION=+